MCVERLAATLSSIPDGTRPIAKLAEQRDLGESMGRDGAILPIFITTAVVLILQLELIKYGFRKPSADSLSENSLAF